MRIATGLSALLLSACAEGPVDGLSESFLRVSVTARDSGRGVAGAHVVFEGREGLELQVTDDRGRAESEAPARDLHVFDRGTTVSVFGAPPSLEVVLPDDEDRAGFRVVDGRLEGPAEAEDRQLRALALADGFRLEGGAKGSEDPQTGLPTHLPRWPAGAEAVDVRVAFGSRAKSLALLVFEGSALVPSALALVDLEEPVPFVRRLPLGPLARVGGQSPFLAGMEEDEVSVHAVTDTGRGWLELPAAETPEGFEGPCAPGACRLVWQRRRRADLGELRGVAVETQSAETEAAPLPVPPPARLEGRAWLLESRPAETVVEVQAWGGGGPWRALVLDGRTRVTLPAAPADALDPLSSGSPRDPIGVRTTWDLGFNPEPLVSTEALESRARAWSRRRWSTRAR